MVVAFPQLFRHVDTSGLTTLRQTTMLLVNNARVVVICPLPDDPVS